MAKVVKRTFSITDTQAAYIDSKVEAGEFASGSEVLRAGLRVLEERDRMLDHVMRELVLPTIERYERDSSRLLAEGDAAKAMVEHRKRHAGAAGEKATSRVRA